MKTKKEFLENYSSNPDLAKKVLKAGGLDWNTIKENPNDYYAANTGSVPGMIYYADTVKFAKRNIISILNALNEFENECGLLENKPTDDETNYYNWLAWFAWENVMSEVIGYLED